MRLDKYIAQLASCSLRKAQTYIASADVQVNGKVCTQNILYKDGMQVCLKGEKLKPGAKADAIYLLLNKPVGIVCTEDKNEPANIIDFLNLQERVFTVGRLDKDSEGLLLLTNDGETANRIIHAAEAHEKEYLVTLNKPLTSSFKMAQLEAGIRLDNTITRPCKIIPVSDTVFRFILTQGLNRQIRRMAEAIGYEVLHLKRLRIMQLELGDLPTGEWRRLSPAEIQLFLDH